MNEEQRKHLLLKKVEKHPSLIIDFIETVSISGDRIAFLCKPMFEVMSIYLYIEV